MNQINREKKITPQEEWGEEINVMQNQGRRYRRHNVLREHSRNNKQKKKKRKEMRCSHCNRGDGHKFSADNDYNSVEEDMNIKR